MVGEARQLYVHRRAVGTLGERDTQDLGGCYGVVAEGLVEVTDTEEQDSIGVLSLELHVLLHHRGLCDLLSHSVLVGLYSEGIGERREVYWASWGRTSRRRSAKNSPRVRRPLSTTTHSTSPRAARLPSRCRIS